MKNRNPSRLSGLFLTLICLSFLNPIFAEVKIPGVISSNMVFQRNAEIKVWGWADKGEMVKVKFNNLTRSSRASKDGKWSVVFPSMTEGGPYELEIQGKNNSINLNNILIGDVWICSGQSNMEWSVARSYNPEEEIKNANHPNIRLLNITRNAQLNPAEDVPSGGWLPCTPENIPNFSAVGYYFGRKVNSETGVPIGLINTSWGGTNIEAWTSADYMEDFPEYTERLRLLNTNSPEKLKKAENLRYEILQRDFNIIKGEVPSEN